MIKSVYKFLSSKFQNVFLDYKVDFKPRNGHGAGGPHPQLNSIVDAEREAYKNRLKGFLQYKEVFHSIKKSDQETNDDHPAWNNDFLPGLDIVAMYSLLRELNPKQYIEIGSGNSTKVVRKAITEGELQTKITSIDPYPRAQIDAMADSVIRKPVEDIDDYSFITDLEAGDILFIDNSHRCLPNSDVTVCFLELLPNLKPGVIVHVHDIYIPYDYPQFMCDRAYSEQYVLAAFMLANPKRYKPVMPNYFVSEDKELSSILEPIWDHENLSGVERHGGSFWFEVTE
jgi:predicted O-methyltransferase YrrM